MSGSRILKATCGSCGCTLQVKTHSVAKTVACPKCGSDVTAADRRPELKTRASVAGFRPEMPPSPPNTRRNVLGLLSVLVFVTALVLCLVTPIRHPSAGGARTVITATAAIGILLGGLSYIRHPRSWLGGVAIVACVGASVVTYDVGRRSISQFRQHREELKQFGLACHNYWDDMGDPIWSLEQVENWCRIQGVDAEKACEGIKSGRYIVVWGQSISQRDDASHPGGSAQVLAYEAAAPEADGLVLMLDGSVRLIRAPLLHELLQKNYRPPPKK